jgi:amicyanin
MIRVDRPRANRLLPALFLSLLAAGISAGGETPAADASISIARMAFHPDSTTIKAGKRVIWTNDDAIGHNVSFKDGSHSATSLSQGQSYSRVFDQPGTYEYFCGLHSYMTGRVIVTAK